MKKPNRHQRKKSGWSNHYSNNLAGLSYSCSQTRWDVKTWVIHHCNVMLCDHDSLDTHHFCKCGTDWYEPRWKVLLRAFRKLYRNKNNKKWD